MKSIILAISFLLAIAFIVYVEGSFSGFAIWNILPVMVGFGALLAGRRSRRAVSVGFAVFGVSVTFVVVLFHLAWLFDWGAIATGSSTSALAFIFVPLAAYAFASVVAILAWGITRTVCKERVVE